MRDHVRILGILNIVMGSLTALIGIVVFLIMGGTAGFLTATGTTYDDTHVAAPVVAVIGVGVAVFFLVLAAPSIIGGWGLLKFRPWARIVIIIVSVFHLLNFPFGTALGVYGLWVLLSEPGRQIFEGGGAAYLQPPSYPAQAGPPPTYPPPPPGA